MINTAAGVIYNKDAHGRRPRSDKTGYTYSTRSYGVGSSLGLAQSFGKGYRYPMVYQYQEIGYNASVVCGFNASSQWGITSPTDALQQEPPYIPNIYWAKGASPGMYIFAMNFFHAGSHFGLQGNAESVMPFEFAPCFVFLKKKKKKC